MDRLRIKCGDGYKAILKRKKISRAFVNYIKRYLY